MALFIESASPGTSSFHEYLNELLTVFDLPIKATPCWEGIASLFFESFLSLTGVWAYLADDSLQDPEVRAPYMRMLFRPHLL